MHEINMLLVAWKHTTQSKMNIYGSHTQFHDKRWCMTCGIISSSWLWRSPIQNSKLHVFTLVIIIKWESQWCLLTLIGLNKIGYGGKSVPKLSAQCYEIENWISEAVSNNVFNFLLCNNSRNFNSPYDFKDMSTVVRNDNWADDKVNHRHSG